MANRAISNGPGSEAKASAANKRPYTPPTLKRLGSVRELTLAGGQTVPDVGTMFMMIPQM